MFRGKLIKILWHDGLGMSLCAKKLTPWVSAPGPARYPARQNRFLGHLMGVDGPRRQAMKLSPPIRVSLVRPDLSQISFEGFRLSPARSRRVATAREALQLLFASD